MAANIRAPRPRPAMAGLGDASPSWASCLVGVLLGVMIIPVVQGRSAGIDPYTAICRALGILPGSPARQQVVRSNARQHRFRRWCGRRKSCKFWPTRSPNGGAPRCRRSASPVTANRAYRSRPKFPHLAGQSGAAIYKQLHDYRTGSRTHPLMTDIAKALEEAQIADVAAYYAGQPKRNPNPATLAESPAVDRAAGRTRRSRRNIPPCAACHRPGSGGPIETPILSEQDRDYLVAQLKMYASGERRNDVYGRMRTIAARLTPAEIAGLARYYRAGFK